MGRPKDTPNISDGQRVLIEKLGSNVLISKYEIARQVGCSRQTVYNYLREKDKS